MKVVLATEVEIAGGDERTYRRWICALVGGVMERRITAVGGTTDEERGPSERSRRNVKPRRAGCSIIQQGLKLDYKARAISDSISQVHLLFSSEILGSFGCCLWNPVRSL